MGIMRRANAQILLDGADITAPLAPYLQQVTVTDHLEGELDDLQITLVNTENKFLSAGWGFKKKQQLSLLILSHYWENEFEATQIAKAGIFFLDEKSYNKETATIKAISAPLKAKNVERSKTWEKISLEDLGQEFATKYDLEYQYLPEKEIQLKNLMQEKETDFAFFSKIADEQGVKVKLTYNKLVLFSEEDFAAKLPTAMVDMNNVIDYQITDKSDDIYDAIEVTYKSTKTNKKETVKLTWAEITGGTVEDEPEKVLRVEAKSKVDDMRAYAKNELEQANKWEIEIEITEVGRRTIYAGCTVMLVNSGEYGGKYLVTTVTNTLPGWQTKYKCYKIKAEAK
ncbi:MAG: late control protein [Fusobacteriaceae bacterium]|jgi:phage protein D|nr:late control protein [Fusobacteriaceae bacterium]